MNKINTLSLLVLFAVIGCATDRTESVSTSQCQNTLQQRSLSTFEKIDRGMSYAEVERIVGPPDKNVGSGLAINLYELPDGSEVKIGWAAERLVYVRHNDQDILGKDH